ncbi:nuclear transport factor 2 family protein [Isoalcanivorax indicus]|uniref:nuclear transport factor 2 family protein n=1 Tax=Isoalcanivorax indicus TaxID=2202653 RepID=UPI0013C515AB|nr:nuclear transport factor 2 family protein [Isoalcanivorax indicus]
MTKHTPSLLALLALTLLLGGCSQTPPEEAIEAAIRDMADAVSQRRGAVVSARLAESFSLSQYEGRSQMDREETRRMMAGLLMRYPDIRVIITQVSVTPDGMREDRAEARFNALVTGGTGGLLPERGQLFRVASDWELIDGDWLLIRASAARLLEGSPD